MHRSSLQTRSPKKIQQIKFNNTAKTIIDLTDPEPRNVFIKQEFDPSFFHLAKSLFSQMVEHFLT